MMEPMQWREPLWLEQVGWMNGVKRQRLTCKMGQFYYNVYDGSSIVVVVEFYLSTLVLLLLLALTPGLTPFRAHQSPADRLQQQKLDCMLISSRPHHHIAFKTVPLSNDFSEHKTCIWKGQSEKTGVRFRFRLEVGTKNLLWRWSCSVENIKE